MDKSKPNLALLLMKSKDKSGESPPKDDTDHEGDLGDGVSSDVAEQSAVKDMMSAIKMNDTASFSSALKDWLEICYPSLADGKDDMDESEPDEGQSPEDE